MFINTRDPRLQLAAMVSPWLYIQPLPAKEAPRQALLLLQLLLHHHFQVRHCLQVVLMLPTLIAPPSSAAGSDKG
jgi:hypothetical protein